jgi:hypothetical protein
MWEYLTLYAKRDNGREAFFVENYREHGERVAEDALLEELGTAGWELVAVVTAYTANSQSFNHQLYFKRPRSEERPTTRLDPTGR